MIKLFVSDVDGTLINDNRELSDSTIEAARKAYSKGVKFMLATGRMHYGATIEWNRLGLDVPMIASQGAVIYEPATGKFISKRKLSKDAVMKLIDFVEARDLYAHVYTEKTFHYNKLTRFTPMYEATSNIKGVLNEDIRECVEDDGSYKFLIVERASKMPELHRECEELFGNIASITRSTPIMLEFLAKGVSKGAAVQDYAEMCGIAREEIICCGNELNDIEMIRAAGMGLAVDNASELLKREADYVIPSNNNEGVRWAIEKFVLGETV